MRLGHSLEDIGNYTLTQFLMFVNASFEIEAADRVDYVADTAMVVGGVLSKEVKVSEHMALLVETAAGMKHG